MLGTTAVTRHYLVQVAWLLVEHNVNVNAADVLGRTFYVGWEWITIPQSCCRTSFK